MTTIKTKLLAHLRQDIDFNKFDDTILKQVVENLEIEDYFLDKCYQDISYVIIDDKTITVVIDDSLLRCSYKKYFELISFDCF